MNGKKTNRNANPDKQWPLLTEEWVREVDVCESEKDKTLMTILERGKQTNENLPIEK